MSSDRKMPLLRQLLARWTSWLGRRGRRTEVEQLGPEGTASIARDIGTSVPELRALAGKWPDTSEDLLAGRLRALNLDPAALSENQPAVARDLSRLCSLCRDKAQCRHDLERRPGSPAWQSYCPNSGTLTALQPEQDGSTKPPAVPRRD